jgi:prepilin-type processing-associated H-X9-DG protein
MAMGRRDCLRLGSTWLATAPYGARVAEAIPARAEVVAQIAEPSSGQAGGRVALQDVVYPLQISTDRRYLVDQKQRPFFMVGDSAQSIYSALRAPELEFYLAARKKKGFNTVLAEPIHWDGDRVMPSADGHLPFLKNVSGQEYDGTLGSADFSAPNPAYWNHVDTVLDRVQSFGFLVVQYVVPWGAPKPGGLWTSFVYHVIRRGLRETAWGKRLINITAGPPQGYGLWMDLTNPGNTEDVCYSFGRWLGRRYRNRSNVLWLDGSDFNGNDVPMDPDNVSGVQRAVAIIKGMHAEGALQLRSGDWEAETISTDEPAFAPYMSVNGVYTYGSGGKSIYGMARHGYLHTPTSPVYLKETGYEGEIPGDAASVRKYEWWCILSGTTTGLIYGNGSVWPFTPGKWQEAMESRGTLDVARIAGLMNSVAWQNLVPSELDGMPLLVTSPNGSQTPITQNYAAAAQTRDGSLLMAYVPPFTSGPQSLRLNLKAMRQPVRARWWDPTSAKFTMIDPRLTASSRLFVTPGTNQGGVNDWLLILDT